MPGVVTWVTACAARFSAASRAVVRSARADRPCLISRTVSVTADRGTDASPGPSAGMPSPRIVSRRRSSSVRTCAATVSRTDVGGTGGPAAVEGPTAGPEPAEGAVAGPEPAKYWST